MKKLWMALLLMWVFSSHILNAQTNRTYFPYVVNDGQTATDLLLTNATSHDALVTLTGYREDGTPVNSSQNPVSVPANAQVKVNGGSFGAFKGWVLAQSTVQGVVGNVRLSSADLTAVDIGEPALPSNTVILPFVSQSGGTSTEISVVNPSQFTTRISLKLFSSAGGTELASVDKQVPPFGLVRGSLPAIFGSDKNYDAASHVEAHSVPANIFSQNVKIVGFEVVRGFSKISADPTQEQILARTDWAALTGIPSESAGTELHFPHVVRGLGWFSLLGVVNLSTDAQTVNFTYSPTIGTPINASRFIPAKGSIRFTAVDLFGAGQDSGSVKISGTAAMAGFLGIGTSAGSGLAVGPAQAQGQVEFVLPTVDETATSYTGLVLDNEGTSATRVDLYLMSPQGTTLGHAVVNSLPPLGRTVKLVRQYFKEGLNVTDGYIFVKSGAAIFAMGVSGITQKTLSNLSPQAALANFTPPGQAFFGIRGKITQSRTGAPVAGVKLTLSRLGTSDQTVTTDATGEYLFKNLMPNTYVLTPTQAGQMFAPVQGLQPSVNATTGRLDGWVVNANSASQQTDFLREALPTLTSIEVVTSDESPGQTAGNNPDPYASFGTAEVSLKLTGTNFASGQKLLFRNTQNGSEREVPIASVSFVDPTTMFVRLTLSDPNDALQLAVAGRYDLTVSGQTPFGYTRSNVLPFYVVPPLPVITDVTPRETYARYEINSEGLTITVRGFGFRQGARVEFNGATGINGMQVDTKFKDSTRLEAYLPPQALRFGGFYILRVRNVSDLPEVSGEAVSFQINNLKPEIFSLDPPGPLSIIGPGPVPVTFDLKINGSNFFAKTTVAVTQKIPDIFPAIVPVGGTTQCIPINGRLVLRVRVYNSAGQPASNVSVTFTAPSIVTNEAAGSFPGGAASVTVTSDALGFAPPLTDDVSTLLTANPFAGSYVVDIKGTVDGFALLAVVTLTNLEPTQGCSAQNSSIEFVSSRQLIVKPVVITSKGTYSVVVANPSPGGGYSSEKEFVVTAGPSGSLPTISPDNALSPPSRSATSGAFNLTVFGSNFQGDAWVNFGTVRLNRIAGDSSSITVTVPALLVPSLEIAPVTVPVSVTNPGSTGDTGGTSDRALFFFTAAPGPPAYDRKAFRRTHLFRSRNNAYEQRRRVAIQGH